MIVIAEQNDTEQVVQRDIIKNKLFGNYYHLVVIVITVFIS